MKVPMKIVNEKEVSDYVPMKKIPLKELTRLNEWWALVSTEEVEGISSPGVRAEGTLIFVYSVSLDQLK